MPLVCPSSAFVLCLVCHLRVPTPHSLVPSLLTLLVCAVPCVQMWSKTKKSFTYDDVKNRSVSRIFLVGLAAAIKVVVCADLLLRARAPCCCTQDRLGVW